MTKHKLLYLDPHRAYIRKAQRYLAAHNNDIEFYGETSILRGIRKLAETKVDLIITKSFGGRYTQLIREVPAQQYGHIAVLSNRQKYKWYQNGRATFHSTRPFEETLDMVVNEFLKYKK